MNNPLLNLHTDYRSLKVYQKAECIYDITYDFVNRFLPKSDRTTDQMLQAARSGKQNIAEGNAAAPTSKETEIKLTNVAKASLFELLEDYKDYLRTRNLPLWQPGTYNFEHTREVCHHHNDTAFYRDRLRNCEAPIIANIAIILIMQEDFMLFGYLKHLEKKFLESGGFKEQMYRARLSYRDRQGGWGGRGQQQPPQQQPPQQGQAPQQAQPPQQPPQAPQQPQQPGPQTNQGSKESKDGKDGKDGPKESKGA